MKIILYIVCIVSYVLYVYRMDKTLIYNVDLCVGYQSAKLWTLRQNLIFDNALYIVSVDENEVLYFICQIQLIVIVTRSLYNNRKY